jgi:hypothetical protein
MAGDVNTLYYGDNLAILRDVIATESLEVRDGDGWQQEPSCFEISTCG